MDMLPRELEPADRQLHHQEIRQLRHQELFLTSSALVVFALITIWIISEERQDLVTASYLSSSLLILILGLFFRLRQSLKARRLALSAYLQIHQPSSWESDWAQYQARYSWSLFAYAKTQSFIFLVLGIASAILPSMLDYLYPQEPIRMELRGIHSILFLVYLGWVGLRVFRSIGDEENRAAENWYALWEALAAVPSSDDA